MPNVLVLIEQISTPPIFYTASFKSGGTWSQHMDAKNQHNFWYGGIPLPQRLLESKKVTRITFQ